MNLSNKLKNFNKFSSKGFTLIELLIVIAILGVLAAGILVVIDPVDKMRQANDAKVQNDVSAMGRAAEAYITVRGTGTYPTTLTELLNSGELKRVPTAPTGYAAYSISANGICGTLMSKRYVNATPATGFWTYTFTTGVSAAATACP